MKNKRLYLLGIIFFLSLLLVSAALAGASHTQTEIMDEKDSIKQVGKNLSEAAFVTGEVLLVDDDDNTPNVLPIYMQILDSLGYSYDVWDTGNSDDEPDFSTLSAYQAVIWFTGDYWGSFSGPSDVTEGELGAYLDNGGCFFISSQEYFYARNLTPFMQNYLGVANVIEEGGSSYNFVYGQGSVYSPVFLGLTYPFTNYSDIIYPDGTSEIAFSYSLSPTIPAGVNKDTGFYKTTYLGFPLEAVDPFDPFFQSQQQLVIKRFLVDCFPNDVLLVDDDNNDPDVRAYYTQTLDALGYHYEIWDTKMSDFEPTELDLVDYEAVVWFTGDQFGGTAGPGGQSEPELMNWLDNHGTCFFLSSQDYLFDRGITPFMTDYLGVSNGVSNVGQSVVTGTHIYGGLGSYTLTFPVSLTNFSDAFTLTFDAEQAFIGDKSTYYPGGGAFPGEKSGIQLDNTLAQPPGDASYAAGSYKDNGWYQTTWLGFPFEALPTGLAQRRTLNRFLSSCFPSNLQTIKTASDPVVSVGESFSYTIQVINHGPYRAADITLQDFIPNQVSLDNVVHSQSIVCNVSPSGNLGCAIPELLPNQGEIIVLNVTALQAGEITNFVFSTHFGFDPDPSNNSTSAVVRVLEPGETQVYVDKVFPAVASNAISDSFEIVGANFEAGTQIYLNQTSVPFSPDFYFPDAILYVTIPAGFPPGEYDVIAVNPGGEQDILYNGFVVYDPNALRVDAVSPQFAPNDHPVLLNIFGDGFSPGMSGKLVDSNDPLIYYPLETPNFISATQVRAVAPYGLPDGIYDVTLYNPDGFSETLSTAYQAIDWFSADDLGAFEFDMFTEPAALRAGEDVMVGLTVRRRTGVAAPYVGGQVNVSVTLGISSDGNTPDILLGTTGVISPNSTISFTVPWTPPQEGSYHLTFDISSLDLVTDTIPQNNQVDRHFQVLPPSSDTDLPVITSLTVNNGAFITMKPSVVLTTTATDASSYVKYIYYVEYVFDRSLGDWFPAKRSGWKLFDLASSNIPFRLDLTPGAHYIQAWVADSEGNISAPKFALINLILPKNGIVHDGGQVYRFPLQSTAILTIDLTSLTGDADIFAWAPDGTLAAASFGSNPFEQIVLNGGGNPPGLYQIDVYGFESTLYWFEVSYSGALESPQAIDDIQGHLKGSDTPLQVIDNNPGGDVNVPSPPDDGDILLPIVIR